MSARSIVIRLAEHQDTAAIADIYNPGIAGRGATFETQPRTAADIAVGLERQSEFPLLMADDGGGVIGWPV